MVKFSTIEVIEQAVQTEKLGNEFYSKMAKRFQQNKAVYRAGNSLLRVKEV